MRMGYRSWAFGQESLRGHIRFGGSTQCRPCYKEKGRAGEEMVRCAGYAYLDAVRYSTNVRERGEGRCGFGSGDEGNA